MTTIRWTQHEVLLAYVGGTKADMSWLRKAYQTSIHGVESLDKFGAYHSSLRG